MQEKEDEEMRVRERDEARGDKDAGRLIVTWGIRVN